MKKKVILAIADGVGDKPCEILGGLTPLEKAKTPNLDKLATQGITGIVDVVGAGIPVGTDLGHMVLFGYDESDYPGRGPIEASGVGIELVPGDVALRCNFATVDMSLNILDRRAGRIRERTNELAKAISGLEIDGVSFLLKEATEHRALLVMRGEGLSANITDSDPKLIKGKSSFKRVVPKDDSEAAKKTADVLNKFFIESHMILKTHSANASRIRQGLHPANFLLTRGAGLMPNLEKTADKYDIKGAVVAAEGTVLGVAKIAGFEAITHKSLTGNLDTNVDMKAKLALAANKNYDFVAINVKAPDLMGHDNQPLEKVQAIEMFDRMIGKLIEEPLEDTIIAVVADHSTPCERMEHSGDPVPALIYGQGIRRDRNTAYNEIDCAHGGLGRIKGYEFVNTLFDFMEKTVKKGN